MLLWGNKDYKTTPCILSKKYSDKLIVNLPVKDWIKTIIFQIFNIQLDIDIAFDNHKKLAVFGDISVEIQNFLLFK